MRYIYSLFFLWAIAHNLNPLLIPILKEVCALTDFQSALVDSAFYIGYFAFALPAGAFIKSKGYNNAIVLGLFLFGVGAFCVGIFGAKQEFYFALMGLFIMAAGLTFLETAANPLVTLLGDPNKATTRLNLAQSFNGLGATLAVFFGGIIFFAATEKDNIEHFIATMGDVLGPKEYLTFKAQKLLTPYLIIAAITIGLAKLIRRKIINLPEIPTFSEDKHHTENHFLTPTEAYLKPKISNGQQILALLKQFPYNLGLLAQFCYVGAQVGIGSFFIRYATTYGQVTQSVAATGLSLGLLLFMFGRFFGTFLMRKISASKLLFTSTLVAIVICLSVALMGNASGFWLLILLQFFMSIMFPSIFSLSLSQLRQAPPLASSLLIMSIVGGAIFPLFMGVISDQFGIQFAYLVPVICFVAVAYFAKRISVVAISTT